jgi:hypothetical protein
MKRVPCELYAEQDDKVTKIMVVAGDDPPVCVMEYDRHIALEAKSVTGIRIELFNHAKLDSITTLDHPLNWKDADFAGVVLQVYNAADGTIKEVP